MALNILYVALGAIVGGLARYFITHFSSQVTHHGFPYGILLVNVIGCFIVGYVLTWTASDHTQDHWRLLAATGFCGAFTTFSAFAFESMSYWHSGRTGMFFLNFGLNNVLCMLAVTLGIWAHNAA
jgi:CrcB protein